MSKTTLFGALGAIMMGLKIDYEKLAAGNRAEILQLGFALMIGLLGYFGADRPASAPGDPTDKRETKGVTPGTDPLAK